MRIIVISIANFCIASHPNIDLNNNKTPCIRVIKIKNLWKFQLKTCFFSKKKKKAFLSFQKIHFTFIYLKHFILLITVVTVKPGSCKFEHLKFCSPIHKKNLEHKLLQVGYFFPRKVYWCNFPERFTGVISPKGLLV